MPVFKNYLKTAFRTLKRNKAFSFINIIGLAIGISASLVIFLIVQYDFSFDTFHKDKDRIYRVVSVLNFSGEIYKNSGVPMPLGPAMKKETTGLALVCPVQVWNEMDRISIPARGKTSALSFKNKLSPEFVDKDYFRMIDYQWILGSPASSLADPYKVVLTDKIAELYFPNTAPAQVMGREIVFDDSIRMTVSGIIKPLAGNTDFTAHTFISRATIEQTKLRPRDWNSWTNTYDNSVLFVKTNAGINPATIEKQLDKLFAKYDPPGKENKLSKNQHLLQPLNDIHFNADYGAFDQRIAHKPTLYGLLAVAAFLLLLGCINFINLYTAQGSQRSREIGIRKTMGSSKKQLISQFLSETFFITITATILSVCMIPLLLKIFSDFIPPALHFDLLHQPLLLGFLAVLVVMVTLLSGFYPAWILSSYQPVSILKNQTYKQGSRKAWTRKSLTVAQFIIAQVFVLATLIVGKQIHYTLTKDMGFNKNAIIYFTTNYRDTGRYNKILLAEKIKAIPGVRTVSLSNGPPSSSNSWSGTISYEDGKNKIDADVELKFADTGYVRQYGLKIIAGNNYPTSDTVTHLLINETYAHTLGFTHAADAVGKYLKWSNKNIQVSGVLADFHQKSLHEKIKPIVIGNWRAAQRTVSVSLQPQEAGSNHWNTTITKIGSAWRSVYPKDDFDYSFFDASIAKYYEAEQHILDLLKWATGLAIFISCLGLLGLVIYTTSLRTKEIGVRKVLGASVAQIISLLSKEFLLLVILAFLVAAPIAWWAMQKWLENFAYRTVISFWLFPLAGVLMILVSLITISFQTFRAAMENPVKSLKTE